ncbi:MAG: radical SAM family heme chaperone HemW, partial [Bacteroidia bacterium]|nr:radical SAM family heme chaperone HemW [Bacteroidia bacterium]
HIPFCKQACFYCDFHFSTSLKKKDELLQALIKEIELRRQELAEQVVETIYFGGGTPSLLNRYELNQILNCIIENYQVIQDPEITLEANPDDLTEDYLRSLADSRINRLSIGIQSFRDEDLKLMNRAHTAEMAKNTLSLAKNLFQNISIDLIYGIPISDRSKWHSNVDIALEYEIPHISSYALTVEPKTALYTFIKKGLIPEPEDSAAEEQFHLMIELLNQAGYIHYELSNFGKPGYFSKNNSAYWQGKSYMGIGPSAHSFSGKERSWNVRNNNLYIKALNEGRLPAEREELSKTDRFNEMIMTGLRTIWGVSLEQVREQFGALYETHLIRQSETYIKEQLLYIENGKLLVTKKGKFLSDGIASHLFKLNLE